MTPYPGHRLDLHCANYLTKHLPSELTVYSSEQRFNGRERKVRTLALLADPLQ